MVASYFYFFPNRYSVIITPNEISDNLHYKWYINNDFYSSNKSICIIPDSFDNNVKLEIYDENDNLLNTIEDKIDYKPIYKKTNDISYKSHENIQFVCIKNTDQEKIIAILPKTNKFVNNNFSYLINKEILPKKHNLSKSDITINKIIDNVYSITNFSDDFGLQYGTTEIWFTEKTNYEILVKNKLLNGNVENDDYNEINYINKFYDPIYSIHLLSKGNNISTDENIFTFYTKSTISNTTISSINNTYYIEGKEFILGEGDSFTYSPKSKNGMEKGGYILYNGYIEVCAPYTTTFEHKGTTFEDVKSIIVENNKTCLVIYYYSQNGDKVPILIPPCQQFDFIDKIKVTDKISIEDVKGIRYEDGLFYYFKENKHVYIKPFIPGTFIINKIITTNGTEENIILTTNERFEMKSTNKSINTNKNKIIYNDKLYSIKEDIILKQNDYIKTDINVPITLDCGLTSLTSDFHYENSKITIDPITIDVTLPDNIRVQKMLESETKKQLMRAINCNSIFTQDVKITTQSPIKNFMLYFIDCSYRVIVPYIKDNNATGYFDKRLMVL